jgi:hypothetical protein
MKIIITENQLKNKVHNLVKELGWYDTCDALGITGEELAQKFFNDDPLEFLNLYTNLTPTIKTYQNIELILYKDINDRVIIAHDLTTKMVLVDGIIDDILQVDFFLSGPSVDNTVKEWIKNNYNIQDFDLGFRSYLWLNEW